LVRGWKPIGTATFKVLGENLFLVEFENVWDKTRVLDGRPWVLVGNLFSLEDFNGLTPPSQIDFDQATFWTRMYNLPLVSMGEDIETQIGSSVGKVEAVDTDEEGMGWGEYLWVKIRLDLSKPLTRGGVLKLKGESVWVTFQYKRLLKFYFKCGMVRHGRYGCSRRNGDQNLGASLSMLYGTWLRAFCPYEKLGNEHRPHEAEMAYNVGIDV
jgi:hypothetical protein